MNRTNGFAKRLAIVIALLAFLVPQSSAGKIFIVDSAADDADWDTHDQECETEAKECTLRAALEQAGWLPNGGNPDEIVILARVGSIHPDTALPMIVDPVIVDGSGVHLDGTRIRDSNKEPAPFPALRIAEYGGGSTIRGLVITGFKTGIHIEPIDHENPDEAGGNTIEGNYIGKYFDKNSKEFIGNGVGIAIINSPNNVIGGLGDKGNIISGNYASGIYILGFRATHNEVRGNFIGTNQKGDEALGNSDGIRIEYAGNNVIGGTTSDLRNVISGNLNAGVMIANSWKSNTIVGVHNKVEGNYIGTDVTGEEGIGNGFGVRVDDAVQNFIGGTEKGAGNVISGNGFGIVIEKQDKGASSNKVQGNLIGTNATGEKALGNSTGGVWIHRAAGNVVGGSAAARNIISGNSGFGIQISRDDKTRLNLVAGNYIGTDVKGTKVLGNLDGVIIDNAPENTIGGDTAEMRNVISGNYRMGVVVKDAEAKFNKIKGNYIGTDKDGKAALPNGEDGVHIIEAFSNYIGEVIPKDDGDFLRVGNVISGNGGCGIKVSGENAKSNFILRNLIGTDESGKVALGNYKGGLWLYHAPENNVGGAVIGPGENVISGNADFGIKITGNAASRNQVLRNRVGTDVTGTSGLGNFGYGIFIDNAPGNIIGSDFRPPPNPPPPNPPSPFRCEESCNLISDNELDGVMIRGTTASGNIVQGNFIGTDISGQIALGNGHAGVTLSNAPNNVVGGDKMQRPPDVNRSVGGNLISGNRQEGIRIEFAGAEGNEIRGNLIGTGSDSSTALGNGSHGVYITSFASNNLVGATQSRYEIIDHPPKPPSTVPPKPHIESSNPPEFVYPNTIAFNGGAGVFVEEGINNSILCNVVFSNQALGIDLGLAGVTANDTLHGDPDAGANNLQNFPVLLVPALEDTIGGELYSTPDTRFLVEFYGNRNCDPSEHGEGRVWLGYFHVETDGNGHAAFQTNFTGDNVTATATDPNGNTSEFSRCVSTEIQIDYGDAPPPYPAKTAENGASHNIINYLYLGNGVDSDWDGQPDPTATGDDIDGSDDEDGVVFTSPLVPDSAAALKVTASGKGILNAWLDFNGDGDWDDPEEQIFTDEWIFGPGIDNLLSFIVPEDSKPGPTFARFRFSSEPSLIYIGGAPDGEVEDYRVEITGPDSDGDGIPDSVENSSCTSPNNPDTDNDTLEDGVEDFNYNGLLDAGETDPCNPDSDGDGLPDGWEVDNNLNPLVDDALEDPDGDGYTNLEEYRRGTDPKDPNSYPSQAMPWIPLLLLED